MNTVIKGTKTIAEYKRVREDMENLARANYARHKEAFEEWGEGEPVKAWFDFEGNFCIEYESGKWWHYNDKGEWLIDDNMVFDIDNLKGFLNDTSSFGFIAKENNKIIGFAYCYTLLRPDGKTMFYLHSIGMLPNYQDKGYGSKLLSFIKEYSKEIGCSEMFLITDKGNPRACHVYEKLGGKNDYKDEIVYVYDYEKGDK